jgi:PAS domain S-box-containing protein
MEGQQKEAWARAAILSFLILVCLTPTLFVNWYGHNDTVYTHLYYVPILVAAIWYHRKAILLAAFFGIVHIAVNFGSAGLGDPSMFLRALVFLFVAAIAALIAEQKDRVNSSLNLSNKELSSIIEFYPDATLIVDNDGKVVAWNLAIETMTGVRAADMIGKGDMEYAIPFYGRRLPMLIDLVAQPEEVRSKYSDVSAVNGRLEAMVTTAKIVGNNSPVLHATASKLYNADGRVTGAIESIRDITLQKRLESELGQKVRELEYQHDELEQQEQELTRQNEELHSVLNLLKGSEEKYRIIAESVNDAICVIDPDAKFTFFNRRAEEITGYRSEDLIGHSALEIVGHELRPRVSDGIGQIIRGRIIPAYEMILTRKDGGPVPVELNASIIKDAGGNPAGLITAFRDITLRRQAEDTLKRYQLLSQYAHDIILFVRGDGRIIEANDAALLTYGYRRDELLAMNISDLRADDMPELVAEQMARADKTGVTFETVHRRKDGKRIHAEVSARGVTIGKERVLLSIVRDISERKRTEAALQASEMRFRNIFEDSAVGIYLIDDAGRILDCNDAIQEMMGYSHDELLMLTVKTITHPDDYAEDNRRFREMVAGHYGSYQIEKRYIRKDGSIMVGRLFKSIVRDPAGKPLYCISLVEDFTERKASEVALSYKNKELSIISSIAAIINRSDSIDELLRGTLSGSLELLELDAGAVYLADPADKTKLALRAFVPRTEAGLDIEPRKSVRTDPSLNTEKVFYHADGGTPLFGEIFVDRTAVIVVPILLKGFAIGLMAYCSTPRTDKREELPDLLSIGSQLGIAIDNHTLMRTLRATSNYMAEIINESPDAIITADARGDIISSNKRVARLLQYDMLELAGMNMKHLLPPGAAELVLAGDKSYVRDFLRKDGTIVTLNISTSHFDSGDVPGGYIIALKDLSEIVGLKIVPLTERAVGGARKYQFEKGSLYLMDKSKGSDCMEIFADQVKHNIQGLCVTRQNPKKLREKYGLEKTPIVWLNGSDLPTGEHCIKPDNLTGLGATIYKFLSEANDGIVLLDGAEYLVARNSFDSVLKFLHLLNDRVMVSNSGVLLCLDPLSLETRQFHLLKTELRDFEER